MAEIRRFFDYRHLRSRGRPPTSSSSAAVCAANPAAACRSGSVRPAPASSKSRSTTADTDFVFQVRSRDYQLVTVQGTTTWRAANPEALADRVDFTIDLRTGRLRTDPLERIASLLTGVAQYHAARYIEARDVQALLTEGAAPIQDAIAGGLGADPRLRDMGIGLVTVRLAGVSPSADLARRVGSADVRARAGIGRRSLVRPPRRRRREGAARLPRTSCPPKSSWRGARQP